MGAGYSFKQATGPWEGVDYRPNDLERNDNAATDMLNAHITPDNLITQRSGTISAGVPSFAAVASPQALNSAFAGLVGYIPNAALGVSNLISGLPPSVMSIISNGGAANVAYSVPVTATLFSTLSSIGLVLQAVGTEFHLRTYDLNNALTSDVSVGYGNETTPVYTLAQLNTLLGANGIGSVTGAAAALTATSIITVGPFDTRINRVSGAGASIIRTFHVWNPTAVIGAIDSTNSALSLGTFDTSNSAGPCDSVTWNQTTTYFTYLGRLYKFDGVRAYTPGPPPGNYQTGSGLFTNGGAGFVDNGAHSYGIQLRYYDANGGNSDGPVVVSPTGLIDIPNPSYFVYPVQGAATKVIVSTYNAYAANYAGSSCCVMGATPTGYSAGVLTFTSHPFVVGDQIVYNTSLDGSGVPGTIARLRIVAVTPTTVTLDPSYATAGAWRYGFCSRNITMLLWRTKVGGTVLYLAGERAFDPALSAALWTDNTSDASLGGAYTSPAYVRGLPALVGFTSGNNAYPFPSSASSIVAGGGVMPYFKYLTIHNGLLVAASGNTVFYTTPANLDTWTADQNSFTIPTLANEQITAIKSFGSHLYVWTTGATYVVTGSLPQPGLVDTSFLLSKVSGTIGCINNKSVCIVEERLVWMDQTGLYSITPGAYPVPIDEPVRPLYLGTARTNGGALVVDTGRACYDPQQKLFYCSLTTQSPQVSASSVTLVWNLVRGGLWEIWSNLNTVGGNVLLPGFGPQLISNTGALVRFSANELGMPEAYTCADGVNPIPFMLAGPQEEMGAPSVSKNYQRFRVLVASGNGNNQAFTLNVRLQRNYGTGLSGSRTFDFNSTAGFGLGAYGVTPYGDPSKDGLNMKPLNTKARSMQPIFTHNTLYEKIRIMGWEYEISPDFKQNKGNK